MMATWTAFYVMTENKDSVVEQLKNLTGIITTVNGKFPSDLSDKYFLKEGTSPNYLAIGITRSGWVTIDHNSFNRLTEWSKTISANLNTTVIVTMAQSVSSVYYFS